MKASNILIVLSCLASYSFASPLPDPEPNAKFLSVPAGSTITLPSGDSIAMPGEVHIAVPSKVKRSDSVDAISAADYENYGFIKYKAIKDRADSVDAISAADYENYGFIKYNAAVKE